MVAAGCLQALGGDAPRDPPATVTIADGALLVDGEPFLVKGIVYSPVPPGIDPLGDDKSWTWIDHPEIYANDFSLMKRMGANAIRVVDTSFDVRRVEAMLDSAHAHGIHVMLGLKGPVGEDAADPAVREQSLRETRDLVRAYRDHPATLLWLLGNEVNYRYEGANVDDWYSLLGEMAEVAHDLDSRHPVATANNALSGLESLRRLAPGVDVYGTNQYAPDSREFVEALVPSFAQRSPGMPFLVTEFGADAWDSDRGVEDEATQARILTANWEALTSLAPPKGPVAGGFVFEWSDEWWKGGNADSPDPAAGWEPPNPGPLLLDRRFSEEYFGILRATADGPVPRQAYSALRDVWASFLEPEEPSVVNLRTERAGDRLRILADVYTYGDVPAKVDLEYRVRSGEWRTAPMARAADGSYAAEFGPLDGIVILFYRVRAVDEAGRVGASEELSARAVPDLPLAAIVAAGALVALARRRRRA